MDNHDSAKEWLYFAQMDLESAKYLQGMLPVPYEIICYHCQQSAEKCLKAILILHKLEVPKIHDLVKLIQGILVYDPSLKPLISVVAGLTDFSTITRYPPTSQISSLEANRAIKDAEEVFKACSNLIA